MITKIVIKNKTKKMDSKDRNFDDYLEIEKQDEKQGEIVTI